MDIEQARYNMVEQQIRPWDVLDQDVLNLLFKIRREDFVPEAHRALAFVDMEIPLGHGQAMWTPKLEARVIQELAIRPSDQVLEIGTGSGYLTALLAMNAAKVVSVEIDPAFSAAAGHKLRAHGIRECHAARRRRGPRLGIRWRFRRHCADRLDALAIGRVSQPSADRRAAVRHHRHGARDAGAAHHLHGARRFSQRDAV